MSHSTTTSVQTFYPALRYADAQAAIAWLAQTFGFEEAVCYKDGDGTIVHAELRFHGGLVMIGSDRDDGYPIKPPAQRGGLTGSIYVAVPPAEIEAHYARAKAAGARLHMDIHETDYGSRDYSAFDPEGYLWSFGTYRP
ncbi:MAG: VOC family protein [Candidatus Velthaea sp.]|jgi:uncharacterized glyoxalase superfamily protein PhnB